MKCQKCGQNEVNFYYSTNVNGVVTKTQLCSECAQGAGYSINNMFDNSMFGFGNIFDGLLPMLGRSGFSPRLMPRLVSQGATSFPHIAMVPVGSAIAENVKCDCGNAAVTHTEAKADDEMIERRQLNMEMRTAVEMEDFEKAAQLRDKIRELDAQ